MRVLESKKPGLPISMGKRKHKLRKQREDSQGFCSESSDEGVSGRGCPHMSKAVNLNTVRKALRQNPHIGECTECKADGCVETNGPSTNGPLDEAEDAMEPAIWFCLQCGHQGCGRDSVHKHALKHFKTPRSSSHAMVLNVANRVIWCYDCDDQVISPSNGKLHECVEYVCKQIGTKGSDSQQPGALKRTGSQKGEAAESTAASADTKKSRNQAEAVHELQQPKSPLCQTLTQSLPKVRGLSNLGNTCFFNAVMQNLGQTYIFGDALEENRAKELKLPGCQFSPEAYDDEGMSSGEGSSEEEEEKAKIQLDPLNVTLGDVGQFTKSVLDLYLDMNGASRNGILSPSSLFNQVCKKVPRFKGFQQQDSHELLRNLLDSLRKEERKRRQEGISKQFDLGDELKRKNVGDDTKLKIKAYWRQAKMTFVERVFGGHFISTVLCEECRTPSQIYEPFLDISLPITEEKTVRPNNLWGQRGKKERRDSTGNEAEVPSKSEGMSKHAMKRARKQSKKESRRRKEKEEPVEKQEEQEGEKEVAEEKKGGEGISDADVEDNVEQSLLQQQAASALSSSEDSTVKGSMGPTSSDVSSSRTKVDTEQSEATSTCHSETTEGAGSQTEELHHITSGMQAIHLQEDSGIAMEQTQRTEEEQRMHEKQQQAKVQKEARLKAMTSLAERYHAVSQECSIMSCLNQFTAPELLTGNNKFGCAVCTKLKTKKQSEKGKKEIVMTNASKQLLILQLPPILTLHLKRFQQMGFSLRKVNRHVEFPLILDMAPYCSSLCQGVQPNQSKVLYALYGIVEHSGRLTGGHYTAYVKVRGKNQQQQRQFLLSQDFSSMHIDLLDLLVSTLHAMADPGPYEGAAADDVKPPVGKWYYISDSRVNEVNHEANILRCQAYLLFYERIY